MRKSKKRTPASSCCVTFSPCAHVSTPEYPSGATHARVELLRDESAHVLSAGFHVVCMFVPVCACVCPCACMCAPFCVCVCVFVCARARECGFLRVCM